MSVSRPVSVGSAQRVSRLLALVPWLAEHDGVTTVEAAAHFGVDVGQLEKDLWLVVCCGLPGHGPDQLIDIQFWDEGGRIHVIDPQTLERPLRLTPDEVVALLIGLRILAQVPGTHDRSVLASATAKLEEAVGDAGSDRIVLVDPIAPEVREAINQSLAEGRALAIHYLGASRDVLTDRVIDPIRILPQEGRTYLEAWCRQAGAFRTFRADRIVSATVLDEVSVRHETAYPAAGEVGPVDGLTVTLSFTARGRAIVESLGLEPQLSNPDGSGRVELIVDDPQWLVRLVLGQGGALVVESPDDLRQRVAQAAREAAAAYETAP